MALGIEIYISRPRRKGRRTIYVDEWQVRNIPENVYPQVYRDIKASVDRLWKAARKECPVKTGRLRASIRRKYPPRTYQGAKPVRGVVWVDPKKAPYARYVMEGTRPHIILPKHPRGYKGMHVGGRYEVGRPMPRRPGLPMLKFHGTNAWYCHTIFTPRVNHPGARYNDFLHRAFEANEGLIYARMVAHFKQAYEAGAAVPYMRPWYGAL